MTTRYFGAAIARNEDRRLLTGQALFVNGVERPGMLHVAFLRSPHAHARLGAVGLSRLRERPGVVAAYAADDLGDYWKPGPLLVPPPPIEGTTFNQRTQVPLARGKVRHAGEPVAVVVAESRYIAEDALADIAVEYQPLPAVTDLERALAPDSERVHDDVTGNVAARVHQRKGDYDAARRTAALVLRRRFRYDRGCSAPIETRGVVADWDAKAERLTVWDTTQAPVVVRNGLAAMLGLSERQVRVVAPFIGGGFGPKIMMFYPEEVLLPWLAIRLERSVKWIEDRAENFVATTQERSQIHDAEIALAADGRILGIRDEFLHDSGAYAPYGLTVPLNSQCTLLGPYVVPAYDSRFTAIFTTLPIVSPYRGAGRQHGVFVIERLLDIAARELGLDRAEIRRRNFIAPDAFPYDNHIIYQDFAPLHYDSGDYGPVLDKALDAIGYRAFIAEEQPQLRAAGRRVDIGVVTGDTEQFHWGVGTFASRAAVVAGNAAHAAAKRVRAKILRTAAEHFECAEADLLLADGQVSIKGVPERNIALGQLAALANPLRGAVQPGTEPGLEATAYFGPAKGATAAGAHAMIVEIDPATMELRILKYVVVHDCGTVINPLIVAGQVHGGVAQGIGNAFYERLVFDEDGQLINGTLADYLLPTAFEVPRIEILHHVTPSPYNELARG